MKPIFKALSSNRYTSDGPWSSGQRAFYSDYPSLNPAEVYIYSAKLSLKRAK